MGTDYLFARTDFVRGMAYAWDLGSTLSSEYNRSATPNLADYYSIKSDWSITGMDLFKAIEQFQAAQNEQS